LLLVEDAQATLAGIDEILTGEGYTCHATQTIADARRLYFEHPRIGVILADVGLRGESGLELPEQLRGEMLWRNPSLLFLTIFDDLNVVIEAMGLGASDYLVKPVSRDKLLATVDRIAETYVASRRALSR